MESAMRELKPGGFLDKCLTEPEFIDDFFGHKK